MTSITYRDGVIAADSRMCYGKMIDNDNVNKLFKFSDGSVLAGAGHWEQILLMVDIFKSNLKKKQKKLPNLKTKCDFIFVDPGNKQVWINTGGFWDIEKRYYSIGSGSVFAFGALDAGADAVTALKIAKGRDTGTGGRIRSIKVF